MPGASEDAEGASAPTIPGVLEELLAVAARGPVGWVFEGFPDERIARSLVAGATSHWDDARTQGKVRGQPVLFVQADANAPRWVAWGRVVEPSERWRVFGVDVLCVELLPGGLAVAEGDRRAGAARGHDGGALPHVWEYPELGRALGLERGRDRTPYLETGARDLRLGVHDLAYLVRLQPKLRRLGVSGSPGR